VHYFKHFAQAVMQKGHEVVFTCRNKEMTINLLNHYNFKYYSLGNPFRSLTGKIFGLLYFTFKLLGIALKEKPDVFLNATMYSAMAARFLRKRHFSLEDTYNMEQVRLYRPFTNCILTGDYLHPSMGKKEIQYAGYQELLYLHPNQFTPDKSVLDELGIGQDEKYVIMRFVSWNASHDRGHSGISLENKMKAVKSFEQYARVFISSESKLPEELESYRIRIQPHRMHDAIAFASLLFGESSTMSEEAAMLGVPSVYLFNNSTFYTQHLEKDYQLMFNFSESEEDQKTAIAKGVELLQINNLKEEWAKKRDNMLKEKIDINAFLVWFIENYPDSAKIMKENPDYQLRFK